ncbi:calcium/calmodulin-dependent protein kinase type 1 [Selaginella moellendorffii]|uniref:calcium/calmodulin-dependent protein kinase type 1 n=1 Tax=Selaginella moellendorffii TaxID=88036 RepID=UPI000D1CE7A7|nr:calcium/calmodulin-dependent protein kinase type 1 [Selaginella moellendorffii]|eukprot:XP_024530416.1 calcium/calmodulin-dependent protein kinase type 1 [Selaginella moellendorffii]
MVACEFGEDDCGELLKLYRRGEKLGSGSEGQVYLLSARRRAVTEEEAAKTIKSLAETLKWMHSRGVVDRDLKPHNIFERLNATAVDEVVIGDFGMATDKQWDMQQYCGTAKYMAPEVVMVKSNGAQG